MSTPVRNPTPRTPIARFNWRVLLTGTALLIGFTILGSTFGQLVQHTETKVVESQRVFTLHTADGRTVTAREHPRNLLLLYFGFTFCPDACPTTLGLLKRVMDGLGPDAQRVQVAFVSVDPGRDTPARMKEYLAVFHPDFIGLGGTPDEIDAAARAFGVIYRRTPPLAGPDTYGFDHTDMVYVIDRSGRQVQTLGTHLSDEDAIDRVRRALIAQHAAECCHQAPSLAEARLRAVNGNAIAPTPHTAPPAAPATNVPPLIQESP